MKEFKWKAIYNPSGKAGEYSYWACNFYTGCSNGCDYCYCRRGFLSSTWSDTPMLKSCFRNSDHALEVFEKELLKNLVYIQKHGLFFSFTTDPLVDATWELTRLAVYKSLHYDVPVKILTKSTTHFDWLHTCPYLLGWKERIAIGFTLTGCDDREPGASTNIERIEAMKILHDVGFKTFASIEPIIDVDSSHRMIWETNGICDLYKVGLMSGKKYYWTDLIGFISMCDFIKGKFYFKDSFLCQADTERKSLPKNCVNRNYNIFTGV